MKKLIQNISFLMLLSGCATTANYEAILNTWVGNSADRLVMSWGPPQSSFTLSDGSKVLEYSRQGNMQIGGYNYTTPQTTYNTGTASVYGTGGSARGTYSSTSTTYVQQRAPTYNIPLTCITRVTVSPSGVITNWSWQGNNCTARKQ